MQRVFLLWKKGNALKPLAISKSNWFRPANIHQRKKRSSYYEYKQTSQDKGGKERSSFKCPSRVNMVVADKEYNDGDKCDSEVDTDKDVERDGKHVVLLGRLFNLEQSLILGFFKP